MRKIHQLPPHLIAQIAAGEVIERPAYAVKELIENSLDAGANTIQIHLKNAGLKEITVIDNGEGMSKEDLVECYKNHTTSKLSVEKNLYGIKTLGFRGEALSSICAVSDVEIRSRYKDSLAGTKIVLENGTITSCTSIGMPSGTHITIENIFHSLPVRKKFLRSIRTELRICIDLVLQAALAHSQIAFTLTHNDRILLDFSKYITLPERIKQLFGADIFSQMVAAEFEDENISLKGYISKPHLSSNTTNKQYLFINNRTVRDKFISDTVRESYGRLLSNNVFPLYILFIQFPHELVDVNVHPRKEQVSFMNERLLHDVLSRGLQQIINSKASVYAIKSNPFKNENMPGTATSLLKDEAATWDQLNLGRIMNVSDSTQVHDMYLITQTYNGICIIDQHASHERILYEQLIEEYHRQIEHGKKYLLKDAIIIHLTTNQIHVLQEKEAALKKIGFSFEHFGNNSIKITHIPYFYQDYNISKLILELCNDVTTYHNKYRTDMQSDIMLKYLACRSAIKAGDPLTKKQQKDLIDQLEKTKNNLTCPHGRPTKVELSLRHMHRYFKRV